MFQKLKTKTKNREYLKIDVPNLLQYVIEWLKNNKNPEIYFGKLSNLIITKNLTELSIDAQKLLNYISLKITETKKHHRKILPYIADRNSTITRNYHKLKQTKAFKNIIDYLMQENKQLTSDKNLTKADFENAYIKTLDSYARQEAITYWSMLKYDENYKITGCFLSDTEDREMFYKFLEENK